MLPLVQLGGRRNGFAGVHGYDLGSHHSCPRCGHSTDPPFGQLLPPRLGARPWMGRQPWRMPHDFPGGFESWDNMGCEWHRIIREYSDLLTSIEVPYELRERAEEVHEFFQSHWSTRRVHPADARRARELLRCIADWLADHAGANACGPEWRCDAAARVRDLRRRIPKHLERYYPDEDWLGGMDSWDRWGGEDCGRPGAWGRRAPPGGGRHRGMGYDRPWGAGRGWHGMPA